MPTLNRIILYQTSNATNSGTHTKPGTTETVGVGEPEVNVGVGTPPDGEPDGVGVPSVGVGVGVPPVGVTVGVTVGVAVGVAVTVGVGVPLLPGMLTIWVMRQFRQ